MNHEQKLQAIIDLIADKEDKVGIEINLGKMGIVTFIGYDDMKRYVWDGHGVFSTSWSDEEVLGTPPDLARVLWYLDQKWCYSVGQCIYSEDENSEINVQKGFLGIEANGGWNCEWNLSEPLLKNQSEEVISFLYDLLITNDRYILEAKNSESIKTRLWKP